MPRTILVAGGYPHQLPHGIVRAFADAGWRTVFFDLSPESPFHRPFVKPVRKLIHNLRIERHPETFDDTPISNLGWRSRRWLKLLRGTRPDAALVLRGNRIALPQLQAAAAEGVPLFCWMLEPASRLSSFLDEAKAGVYRKMFVYARSYLERLAETGAQGVYYPHRAMELPDEARVLNRQRRYQWSFLGSLSPWREEALRAVAGEFPHGFIAGSPWQRLRRDPLLGPVIHPGYFQQKESMELYLDSQVGLDISSQREPGTSGVAMRVPELLACGCKVLVQDAIELRSLPYAHTPRLGLYRSIPELLDHLRREFTTPAPVGSDLMALAREVTGHRELVELVAAALEK